eukprot:403331510
MYTQTNISSDDNLASLQQNQGGVIRPQLVTPIRHPQHMLNPKIIVPQPQVKLPFPWIPVNQQQNHQPNQQAAANYNYMLHQQQRNNLAALQAQQMQLSQLQAQQALLQRQAIMQQPQIPRFNNYQINNHIGEVLNNQSLYNQQNSTQCLQQTPPQNHQQQYASPFQNTSPFHAYQDLMRSSVSQYEELHQNLMNQLSHVSNMNKQFFLLSEQQQNGVTIESEFQTQTHQNLYEQQHLSQSQEQKSDLQITEVLTKTRRKELETALTKATSQDQVVIQSKLKRKQTKSTRGSQYRGVSKNGKKWQVQLLGNLKKHYIGSISTELKAAKIYDRHAIQTHGLRAKTNFQYTKQQIEQILDRQFDEESFEEECALEATTQDHDTVNHSDMRQVTLSSSAGVHIHSNEDEDYLQLSLTNATQSIEIVKLDEQYSHSDSERNLSMGGQPLQTTQ